MDKILKIQSEIGVLVKTETNPFFHSKYVDINGLLEQLLPLLEKYEITVIQPLSQIEGQPALRTIIFSDKIELINECIPLPTEILEKLKDGTTIQRPLTSQEFGSAITYFRRYALQSLFLLRAEDDDANNASEKKVGKKELQAKNKADFETGEDPF